MRVTAEAKAETRQRILAVTDAMLAGPDWESATTRAIADAAGIAAGTLFNYFPSKEAVAATLVGEALDGARSKRSRKRTAATVEEELFELIWGDLRSLRRYRDSLSVIAETIFSPTRSAPPESAVSEIRVAHLEAAERILTRHGVLTPLPFLTAQLYWTLYVGVLAFWSRDPSPRQEDSLALLDQSLHLFLGSLGALPPPSGHRGRP